MGKNFLLPVGILVIGVVLMVWQYGSYGQTSQAGDGFRQSNDIQPPPKNALPHTSPAWLYDGPIYNTNAAYYQGGLKELTKWVPHLKDIGVKTIYLMTIWADNTYTPMDYYKISPRQGTEQDLKGLVEAVHKNDMRILLDLVTGYSHISPANFIYNTHPEWHIRDKQGNILRFYPDRWGPAIDRSKPEVIEYFVGVARYYVEKYDIDGWRIDAPQNNYDPKVVDGDHSATELLRQVRQAITSVKPDAVLLSEIPGPACEGNPAGDPLFDEMSEISYDWFLIGQTKGDISKIPDSIKMRVLSIEKAQKSGKQPDVKDLEAISKWAKEKYGIDIEIRSVQDLRTLQAKFLLIEGGMPSGFAGKMMSGEATSIDLVDFIKKERIWYGRTRARWFENHDTHVRTGSLYPNHYRNLLILISTLPGVPFIHAGQETGETEADTFNRSPVNEDVRSFYKKVFSVRSKNLALKYGASIENVWKFGDNTYAYLRQYEDSQVVVVLNFQNKATTTTLNLPFKAGDTLKDELSGETFVVDKPSSFQIPVPAYGARILVLR